MLRITRSIPALLAALAACAELPLLDPDLDRGDGGQPLAITRFDEPHLSRSYSGFGEPARIVVQSQEEWAVVARRLWARDALVPAVDFSREVVVVAAMGGRSTGGYGIEVREATAYADHVSVRVEELSPGRSCAVTLALTAPVDVVRLPRPAQPIRFHTETRVHRC